METAWKRKLLMNSLVHKVVIPFKKALLQSRKKLCPCQSEFVLIAHFPPDLTDVWFHCPVIFKSLLNVVHPSRFGFHPRWLFGVHSLRNFFLTSHLLLRSLSIFHLCFSHRTKKHDSHLPITISNCQSDATLLSQTWSSPWPRSITSYPFSQISPSSPTLAFSFNHFPAYQRSHPMSQTFCIVQSLIHNPFP